MKPKLIRITTVPQSLYRLLEGQLHYMNQYYEVLGISSSGEALERVRVNEGIRVIPVEMTRTISPLKDLKSVWKLYKIFKKERPFIVHTHTPKAGTVGMLAARLSNVPVRLHTVAGLPLVETYGLKRKILDVVERATYSCATMVYPNSKGLYEIILKYHYCAEGKLKVLAQGSSNGIDVRYFDPSKVNDEERKELKEQLNISSDDFVFIFIGRLVKAKGVNELVEAFLRLQKMQKNVKLLVLGKYETDLDPLKSSTVTELEENSSILYVGYQQDIRPYLAISDVFAFPSYREGFPNVVLQAGAMGLPSIVSDINGCNEIVISDENGIIIPPKNTEALYIVMKLFLDKKELIERLSKNCRQLVVSRYNQQLIWDSILKEYNGFKN